MMINLKNYRFQFKPVTTISDIQWRSTYQSQFWLGVAGIVLVFLTLGSLRVFTLPLLRGDEQANAGYVLQIAKGALPDNLTRIPMREILTIGPAEISVYVYQHPPLYYAIAAIPVKLGIMSGHPIAGLRAARLLTLAFAAMGIVVVVLLARLLVPNNPKLSLAMAAFTALISGYISNSALIYNESLCFLASSATILGGFLVLFRGFSWPRVAFIVIAASLASLTRFSGTFSIGFACIALGVGIALHAETSYAKRLLKAVAVITLVVISVGLASGWFYARNHSRYGDVTGTKTTLESRGKPAIHYLLTREFMVDLYNQLWGRWSGGIWIRGGILRAAQILFLLVLIGLGRKIIQYIRRGTDVINIPIVVAWVLSLGYFAFLIFALAEYHSRGGGASVRYVVPGLWVLGALTAVGLYDLDRRYNLVLETGLIVQVVLNIVFLEKYLSRTGFAGRGKQLYGTIEALRAGEIPFPSVYYAISLCLIAAGLAVQLRSLRYLPMNGD